MNLTEIDEKYLFEVEVKIKMGHESAQRLLWDTLSDYPAPALLSHTGLILAVIDVIGSSNSSVDAEVNPKCLSSSTAMLWLEKFIKAIVQAYTTQLDGSLCSLSLPSNNDGATFRTKDEPPASLATNITHAMQNLRFPNIEQDNEVSDSESGFQPSKLNAKITASGVLPAPSLPGLAFAACAASMPLIQSSDMVVKSAVISLLKTALPYIKEPTPFGDINSCGDSFAIDRLRLQHLLNRVEKIISTIKDSSPSLEKIVNMMDFDNSSSKETPKWIIDGSSDSALFRVVIHLISMIPKNLFQPLNDGDSSKTGTQCLSIGTKTLSTVRHICTFSNTLSLMIASEEEIGIMWDCLQSVDPPSHISLKHCQKLIESAQSLQASVKSFGKEGEKENTLEILKSKLSPAIELLDVEVTPDFQEINAFNIVQTAVAYYAKVVLRNEIYTIETASQVLMNILCSNSLSYRKIFIDELFSVTTGGKQSAMSAAQKITLSALGITKANIPANKMALHLCNPSFLYSLITMCIFEGRSEQGLADSSMLLLQYLLGNALNDNRMKSMFSKSSDKWAELLKPLRIIEWGLEIDSDKPISSAIGSFVGHLDEYCSRCKTGSVAKIAFDKALSLGIFHCNSVVRAHCATRLRNEIQRYHLSPASANIMDDTKLGIDPFAEANNDDRYYLYLCDWFNLNDAQNSRGTTIPPQVSINQDHNSLANATKLASIAFADQTTSIRITAMRQLRNLCTETDIISMSEDSWTINVAASASQVLGNFYVYFTDKGMTMNVADARLCHEAALLLRLFVNKSIHVRSAARYVQSTDRSNNGRIESAHFSILPIYIAVLQLLPDGVSAEVESSNNSLISDIRRVCCQTLCVLVHADLLCSESLDISFQLFKIERKEAQTQSLILFPEFMAKTFSVPLSAENLSSRDDFKEAIIENDFFQETLSQVHMCSVKEKTKIESNSMLIINSEFLSDMLRVANVPDFAVIEQKIAATICKALALSASHQEMRDIISSAGCLTHTIPLISSYYGTEKMDLAFERFLKTAPQSKRDMLSLSYIIDFFTSMVTSFQGPSSSTLYENILTAILFPLYDLVKGNHSNVIGKANNEQQTSILRETIQDKLLNLLKAMSYIKCSAFPKLTSILGDHELPQFLLHMMDQEENPSIKKSTASLIMLQLIENHGIFSFKDVVPTGSKPTLDSLFKVGPCNVLQCVTRTAKMLRKPDSVQGYGSLVGSMKILLTMLKQIQTSASSKVEMTDGSSNWRWLVRLFYDRRAEVRVLALEIFDSLRKLDENFEDAMNSSTLNSGNNSSSSASSSTFSVQKYLYSIAFDDNTECLAVRNSALRILSSSKWLHKDETLAGQILACVQEQLSCGSEMTNSSSLSAALSCLMKLTNHSEFAETSLNCARSLKLVPLVMSIIQSDISATLEKIAFRRVGVHVLNLSITGGRQWFESHNDIATDDDYGFTHGWNHEYQKVFNLQGRLATHLSIVAACRYLQATESANSNMFYSAVNQFSWCDGINTCFTQSNFVRDCLITNATNTVLMNQGEMRAMSALSDLTSVVMMRKDSNANDSFFDKDSTITLLKLLNNMLNRQINWVAKEALDTSHAFAFGSLIRLVCVILEGTYDLPTEDLSSLLETLLNVKAIGTNDTIKNNCNIGHKFCLNARVDMGIAMLLSYGKLKLNTSMVSKYMSIAVRNTNLIHDAVRKTERSVSTNKKNATSITYTRLELWATLTVLQSVFSCGSISQENILTSAEGTGFPKCLGLLIEMGKFWSLSEEKSATTTPAFTSLYAFVNASTNMAKVWIPSFTQLTVVSLSVCCSFCNDNVKAKQAFVASRDMSSKDVGIIWGTLFDLVYLAVTKNVSNSIQLLSLSIISSVISCTYESGKNFVQKSKTSIKYTKSTLLSALGEALQQNASGSSPESLCLLLDALGSCFLAECASMDTKSGYNAVSSAPTKILTGSSTDIGLESEVDSSSSPRVRNDRNININDSTSTPTMLKWVWESFSGSPNVVVALVRFIGKLSASAGSTQNYSASIISKKLCLAAATSSECLRIVTDSTYMISEPEVSDMACLALWATIHASEQARANVKKLTTNSTNSLYESTKENYPSDKNKAKIALRQLLE